MSSFLKGDEKMKRFGSLASGKLTATVHATHSQGQIIRNTVESFSYVALCICLPPRICCPSQLHAYHKLPAFSPADMSM